MTGQKRWCAVAVILAWVGRWGEGLGGEEKVLVLK